MHIVRDAVAGTLESSDVMVKVSPLATLEVSVSSTVMRQFGDQIKAVVADTLDKLGVDAGSVEIEDKGALDCTIRARVQAAVSRASDNPIEWSML